MKKSYNIMLLGALLLSCEKDAVTQQPKTERPTNNIQFSIGQATTSIVLEHPCDTTLAIKWQANNQVFNDTLKKGSSVVTHPSVAVPAYFRIITINTYHSRFIYQWHDRWGLE